MSKDDAYRSGYDGDNSRGNRDNTRKRVIAFDTRDNLDKSLKEPLLQLNSKAPEQPNNLKQSDRFHSSGQESGQSGHSGGHASMDS